MKPLAVGALRIERIVEFDPFPFDLQWLYPEATDADVQRNLDWLDARTVDAATNTLFLSMHAYLLRLGGKTLLIDTCIGHKPRPSLAAFDNRDSPLLDNLRAAGVAPDDVDVVICTHLHADHVGWNTQREDGAWVPTFKNAIYVFARKEYNYYRALHDSNPPQPVSRGAFEDSILPVVAARQARFVASSEVIEERNGVRIWLEDASGHTPGQIAVRASGGGREVLFLGDTVHHPLGIAEPQLVMSGDVDPAAAIATRRRFIEGCADGETIVLTAHFPSPTAVRIVSSDRGFRAVWL